MEGVNVKEEVTKILIVDDIVMNVEMMKNIIESRGYTALCALSVREAVNIFEKELPSLILSDLSMPEIDGIQFCQMVKGNPRTKDIPFIFVSILDTSEEKENAFKAGAADFISKPIDATEVIMRVDNHLNFSRMKREMADYNYMLHQLVEKQQWQVETEQVRVLSVIIRMLEKLDGDRGGYLKNVGRNCRILSQSLQLLPKYEAVITDKFVENIEAAAQLYDMEKVLRELVGKAGIQEADGLQTGCLQELAEEEKRSGILSIASNIANYRGTRWDGTGCPGLKGEEIPLEARIMALAEDFGRYAGKLAEEGLSGETMEEMKKKIQRINEQSGKLYDPDIIKTFNKVWRRMAVI